MRDPGNEVAPGLIFGILRYSLPFHILQFVKSLAFHHLKPEFQKRYLFWAEPPLIGQKESIPRDKRSDRNLVPSLLLASRNVHNAKCTRIGINIYFESSVNK